MFRVDSVSSSYIFKRLINEDSSWDSAQQWCTDRGHTLVRLNSEEEWQQLIEMSNYQLGNHLFIFIDAVCENSVGITCCIRQYIEKFNFLMHIFIELINVIVCRIHLFTLLGPYM